MAAALRRRNAPPPARGPPPIKIRPQCGGTVVTFEGDALGFFRLSTSMVYQVVSEASTEGGRSATAWCASTARDCPDYLRGRSKHYLSRAEDL